jgi:hypothetical protein
MAAQLNAHPAGFRLYVDQALVKARPPPAQARALRSLRASVHLNARKDTYGHSC